MIISPPPVIPTPTFNPATPRCPDPHVPTNILTALLDREELECVNIFQCRTTANIVLSCLTTIFACTWVALHLDTPSSSKSGWRAFGRRLCCMIIALIAPEIMVGDAMGNLLDAKKHKDAWNANFMKLCSSELVSAGQYKRELRVKKYDTRWTLTHRFLASMYGIQLYNRNDMPPKFKPTRENFRDPKMRPVIRQIGLISQEDIEDKSKGDGIAKLFVVLQTTWFIIQCLARWTAQLPVTELEVVTLAYAVLNIFIYTLLWYKPQSLCVPFRVFDGGQVPEREEIESTDEEEGVSLVSTGEEDKMSIPVPHSPSATTVGESSTLSGSGEGRKRRNVTNELEWVDQTYSGIQEFFISPEGSGPPVLTALSGTIFGALHLIPLWLSVFPSDIERELWRFSAFYVAVAPLGTFAAAIVVARLLAAPWVPRSFRSNTFGYVLSFSAIAPYAMRGSCYTSCPYFYHNSFPSNGSLPER